ncbi:hypothetical protein F750_5357 [Streptomyces sp. PAMC 26508]|nr:hypothetical protein F750_5357 [Streptomyces sp. PAMC 26508]
MAASVIFFSLLVPSGSPYGGRGLRGVQRYGYGCVRSVQMLAPLRLRGTPAAPRFPASDRAEDRIESVRPLLCG